MIDYFLAVEAIPTRGDRSHRHDRDGGRHRPWSLRSTCWPAASISWRNAASILAVAIFATEFGRDLEYYSGLVFQIEAGGDKASPIAGGGRYDSLLRSVGARAEVPAVGSAIHTERLLACVKGLS